MPPTNVHLNGSVNLADTETVMRELATRIPVGLRRVPDGETGERIGWIGFQVARFMAMPEFEVSGDKNAELDGREIKLPRLRLVPGVAAEKIAWPDLGYAKNYVQSYGVFRRLREEGVIKAGTRFQMQYPTPRAPIMPFFIPDDALAVWRSYEAALFRDLAEAIAQLPREDIAVQWDVALEITFLAAKELADIGAVVPEQRATLETLFALGPSLSDLVTDVARCLKEVPEDVPAGVHLCYGDYGHRHAVQPRSLELQVAFLNALASKAQRQVSWASLTVPQDRSDEAFFAPLGNLDPLAETEVNFGIVPYHPSEQPADTTTQQVALIDRYIAEASGGSRAWGISQECGLGRVDTPDEVLGLLDLHRQILERYGQHAVGASEA